MARGEAAGGGAQYLTSVCTGSLILGAAGLLKGKRAACHWAWRDMLSLFGAIPDAARVVRDGNIITGGGVTAGIDFAFVVAAELAGEAFAQGLQLGLEYAPAPPFNGGRPETAPPEVLAQVEGPHGRGACRSAWRKRSKRRRGSNSLAHGLACRATQVTANVTMPRRTHLPVRRLRRAWVPGLRFAPAEDTASAWQVSRSPGSSSRWPRRRRR